MGKKKILIIDDEIDFTRIAKLNLEETGRYEVRTENRGSRGVTAAKEFKPGLILLDIMMPVVDGGEVCFLLNSDEETKNIPVVFLTALINKKEARKKDNIIKGHPFIAKPVSVDELIDVIQKYLLRIKGDYERKE